MKGDNGTSKARREWRQLHILIEALRKSCMKKLSNQGQNYTIRDSLFPRIPSYFKHIICMAAMLYM